MRAQYQVALTDNPTCDSYTEKDSLEAAQKLENKIVTSDRFFMEREDCIFAHVNTTIVSLCNGNGRPRHINRAEGTF